MSELKTDAVGMSFAQRVWYTLSNVDVTHRLKKKTKFEYLPWADAWEILMGYYPESSYEFDPPAFFENGTGEQWVTVTIREGDQSFTRRWWLPYLSHTNQPLTSPTALQINNTRMRALVKCIAMMGLGVHVFSGEDVPDEGIDTKTATSVKRTSVRAAVMEDITLTDEQQAIVTDWISALKEAMPNEAGIDHEAVLAHYKEIRHLGELQVVIADGLNSWQRSEVKRIGREYNEQLRAAAIAKVQA